MTDARNYRVVETLKDGTAVTIRAIRRDDRGRILEAFSNLERQSIYTRFFSFRKGLTDQELDQLTDVDFHQVAALVVTTGTKDRETLIAGGRYISDEACRSAELAFTTEEDYQGRGIASLLLAHLVRIAREQGVSQFEADVLAENHAMLSVFRRSGLPIRQRRDGSVMHVTLSLATEGA